jgi:uncharacterized RDD family membrane protein YckC
MADAHNSASAAEPVYAPASFLARVGSTVIDVVFVLVIAAILSPVMAVLFYFWPVGIALSIFYVALLDSSRFQGTPGKIALGMRVTDMKGRRLSLRHAVWRGVCHYLSLLPPVLLGHELIKGIHTRCEQ